jgi:hypothetical protein
VFEGLMLFGYRYFIALYWGIKAVISERLVKSFESTMVVSEQMQEGVLDISNRCQMSVM